MLSPGDAPSSSAARAGDHSGFLPSLSIVTPCYNEEEVLPETRRRLTGLLEELIADGKISSSSCIYFVDDGSRDRTLQICGELAAVLHSIIA